MWAEGKSVKLCLPVKGKENEWTENKLRTSEGDHAVYKNSKINEWTIRTITVIS